MDFLKELLQIQHEIIVNQISEILLPTSFEKYNFVEKYNKNNYYLVKVCNCQMKPSSRVKIDILLSTLESDHNPSFNR